MPHEVKGPAFETIKTITGPQVPGWRTLQSRVCAPAHHDLQGATPGQVCLVKLLTLPRHEDAERIWHDARLLSALPPHPHVVRYYGAILRRAAVQVASEWSDEGSLLDLLQGGRHAGVRAKNGCVALDVATDLFINICAGLHFLHVDVLLAHGNLRPSNILLVRPPGVAPLRAKLSDVGLADLVPLKGARLDPYLAPERQGSSTRGGESSYRGPSAPADLYAAGIVLVDLLAPPEVATAAAAAAARAGRAAAEDSARAVAAHLVQSCVCGRAAAAARAGWGCVACEVAEWLPQLLALKADVRPTAGAVGDAVVLARRRVREKSQGGWAKLDIDPPAPLRIPRAERGSEQERGSRALTEETSGWGWTSLAQGARGEDASGRAKESEAASDNKEQSKSVVPQSEVLNTKWSWPTRRGGPAAATGSRCGERAGWGVEKRKASLAERYLEARGVVRASQENTDSGGRGIDEEGEGQVQEDQTALEEAREAGREQEEEEVFEWIEGMDGKKVLGATTRTVLGHRVVVVGAPQKGQKGAAATAGKGGVAGRVEGEGVYMAEESATMQSSTQVGGAGERWGVAERPILRGLNGAARWLSARVVGATWKMQGAHTEYTIRCQGGGRRWEVGRRFTDFLNLAASLRPHAAATALAPLLPPKTLFGWTSPGTVRARQDALSRYLDALTRLSIGPPPHLMQAVPVSGGEDDVSLPAPRPIPMEDELLANTLLTFLDAPPALKVSSIVREQRRIKWREQLNDELEIERVGRGLKSPRRKRVNIEEADCQGQDEETAVSSASSDTTKDSGDSNDAVTLETESTLDTDGALAEPEADRGVREKEDWDGREDDADPQEDGAKEKGIDIEGRGRVENSGGGRHGIVETTQERCDREPRGEDETDDGAHFALEVGALGVAMTASIDGVGFSGVSITSALGSLDDSEDDLDSFRPLMPDPMCNGSRGGVRESCAGVESEDSLDQRVEA